MNIRRRRGFPLSVLLMILPFTEGAAWWWHDDGELNRLVLQGLQDNPELNRQGYAVREAQAEQDALSGFWDPMLSTVAGRTQAYDGEDRSWVGGHVRVPVPRAGYLTLGVEQGIQETAPDAGDDRYYQTTARMHWRLPLWRDRGFREWRLLDTAGQAQYAAADARRVAAAQALRRDISLGYLALMERYALLDVAASSLDRAEQLMDEAEALAELDTIPRYLVAVAAVETALRREEKAAAELAVETQAWRLRELLGTDDPIDVRHGQARQTLVDWAAMAPAIGALKPKSAILRRGDLREIAADRESVDARYALAVERRRADIALELQVDYLGEDPDAWPATAASRHERATAMETRLSWSRPWGYRAERAEAARQVARRQALEQRGRTVYHENRVRLQTAVYSFETTRHRLVLADAAVNAADMALQAESERFHLGEGRSRDVLDAQKTMTDTLRRQIVMAVELLRASVDVHYSVGFAKPSLWLDPADGEATASPPLHEKD